MIYILFFPLYYVTIKSNKNIERNPFKEKIDRVKAIFCISIIAITRMRSRFKVHVGKDKNHQRIKIYIFDENDDDEKHREKNMYTMLKNYIENQLF
jgi:hypothetical protein